MRDVKAIICDVYRTVLEVGEAPQDAEARWKLLFEVPWANLELSLEQLSSQCHEIIAQDHRVARQRGILYPEVNWPSVMSRALPELDALSRGQLDNFLFNHAQLFRSLRVMAGCASVFRECRRRGILLGIASNAQAYTLKELELALRNAQSGFFNIRIRSYLLVV